MRVASGWLVGLVAAGTLLAGCADDGEGGPTLAPASSAPDSPSPAAAPSPTPSTQDPAGLRAESIVQQYFDELARLSAGEATVIENLYSESCGTCRAQIERIRGLMIDGRTLEPHETTLEIEASGMSGQVVAVRVIGHEETARLLDAEGRVVAESPAVDFSYLMQVFVDGETAQIISFETV